MQWRLSAFVGLDVISSVLSQEIGWEDHLRNHLFVCQVGFKINSVKLSPEILVDDMISGVSNCVANTVFHINTAFNDHFPTGPWSAHCPLHIFLLCIHRNLKQNILNWQRYTIKLQEVIFNMLYMLCTV